MAPRTPSLVPGWYRRLWSSPKLSFCSPAGHLQKCPPRDAFSAQNYSPGAGRWLATCSRYSFQSCVPYTANISQSVPVLVTFTLNLPTFSWPVATKAQSQTFDLQFVSPESPMQKTLELSPSTFSAFCTIAVFCKFLRSSLVICLLIWLDKISSQRFQRSRT